jgi:hypothetical protein
MRGAIFRLRNWLAYGLAFVLLFAAGRGALAIDAQRFGDGQWYGMLTGSGTVEFDDDNLHTTFTSRWQGSFGLNANSGVVIGGSWSMTGNGISHVETGGSSTAGHATFTWGGATGGEATAPKLGGRAVMHMTVLGQSIDATVPREQTSSPQLEIYTSDCTRVTGDWTAGISNGITDNGGVADITGPFVAFNATGALVTQDTLNQFTADAVTFEQHFLEGDFEHGELSSLILRAEELEALLRGDPSCVVPDAPGFFAIFVWSIVRDLIDYAFAHPGDFDTDDLLFITRAGVRAGVLGAGAPDQAFAQSAGDRLMTAFDGRLTLAISNGDRVEAAEIMELAIEMSWPDVVAKAAAWLNG